MSWEGPDPQRDEDFIDPFKDVKFEHDFQNADEIAASVETTEDAEPTDEAPQDSGPQDGTMAWEGYQDAPFLRQVARIAGLARFAKENFAVVQGIIEEGVPADILPCELTLNAVDEQVISIGLNLVGFFVPEMGDAAKDLAERLMAAVDAKEIPDDVKAQLEAAVDRLNEKAFAEMYGLSVEEYRELLKKEIEAKGDAIVVDAEAPDPGDAVSWN